MELEELAYEINYRPGRDNVAADYLSRNRNISYDNEVNQEQPFEEHLYAIRLSDQLKSQILNGQRVDPVVREVVENVIMNKKLTKGQFWKVSDRFMW